METTRLYTTIALAFRYFIIIVYDSIVRYQHTIILFSRTMDIAPLIAYYVIEIIIIYHYNYDTNQITRTEFRTGLQLLNFLHTLYQ